MRDNSTLQMAEASSRMDAVRSDEARLQEAREQLEARERALKDERAKAAVEAQEWV